MINTVLTPSSQTKKIIHHSLNNANCALTRLALILTSAPLNQYTFSKKERIENYTFDFYSKELHLAIEVDSYVNEFPGHHNTDSPKKLYIASLGIQVLRFTDYQLLTDTDEISRTIRYYINQQSND